jgi:peptidoglycan hydrolase-like protein with peptidoglycan-binding domain
LQCAVALSAVLAAPAAADTLEQKDKIEGQGEGCRGPDARAPRREEDHRGVMTDQDAMAAQQTLQEQGRDPGTIDGRMGRHTRAVLADYQKTEGLKVTGRLGR